MPIEENITVYRSQKSWVVAILLCFFLGLLGIHRFYLGKTGSGVLMLILTITVLGMIISGIWALVDFLVLLIQGGDTFDRKYNSSPQR